MVIPKSVIKFESNIQNLTQIIPNNQNQNSNFFSSFLSILGIAASIAISIIAPESIPATIGVELAAAGVDLGFQELSAIASGTNLSASDILFSLGGSAAAGLSSIRAARIINRTKNVIDEVASSATSKGYNSLQFNVITKNASDAILERQSARIISQQLVRAGLTENQALQELENFSRIFKRNGINNNRFDSEISFIKQESFIFTQLKNSTEKFGVDINEIFETLEKSGIDIIGVQNTYQLAREIRFNSNAIKSLKDNKLFLQLESALERDLEPSLFTRVLNVKNTEKALEKANKILSLSNPNALINEITNKVFDPIKSKFEEKVLTPFKKKVQQKMKHLLRQDLVRKQETKNGVYPCFGSSWINYLRAVPISKGIYKCRVIFRKWGYRSVTITPEMDLQTIINWSESSSPGRIYHKFRRRFGGKKGLMITSDENLQFKADTSSIFNLLQFIPSKYISLGVSLIGNISTARSAISLDSWSNFFDNSNNFLRPLEDKSLEIFGGQLAKSGRDQLMGNKSAMQNYFSGKLTQSLESRESEFRKNTKQGKGNLDSVKSIKNIIK